MILDDLISELDTSVTGMSNYIQIIEINIFYL